MIYLIVNIHRSGSSMMMRCLEAGGLTPVYDKLSDKMVQFAPKDYSPNPNGFYTFTGIVDSGFYNLYRGKLIKFPFRELSKLPLGDYKVIVLKRSPGEIRKSMTRWTPFQSWGMEEVITYNYTKVVNAIIRALKGRSDISLIEVNYKDIVKNPLAEFERIKASGWPINAALCAEKVDSSLHRNKLEKDI